MNFENILNQIRTVLRGEVSGSIRFVAVILMTLIIWTGVYVVSGWKNLASMNLTNQQNRWRTLFNLGNEYKNLDRSGRSNINNANVDVAAVFAQVTERLGLDNRVNRVTPDGRNQSIEINKLYGEELADLEHQLSSRGIIFNAAELRALPSGRERLLTVNAIIGPVN